MLQESAFYEYVKSLLANLMPGAVVLGGFPSFSWGQRGTGPVPADLDALTERVLPGSVDFDAIIDELFRFDSASPPMMRVGGSFRPAVRAFFATGVMYYSEREAAGEMAKAKVGTKLRDVVMRFGSAPSADAAHETLTSWGRHLRERFEADNVHLISKDTATGLHMDKQSGGAPRGDTRDGGAAVLGRIETGFGGVAPAEGGTKTGVGGDARGAG